MNDRMQLLEDLDVLVRMCRSKNDGASLVIEEEEINQKISELTLEIDELKSSAEEENYDTSAEMADRNIEIITKKVINTIKIELKNKNLDLLKLKEKEKEESDAIASLKSNKKSHETYIASMQERISSTTDEEVINRYTGLITESEDKVNEIITELDNRTNTYSELQKNISDLALEIENLEKKLNAKQEQLLETQHNLESKETYIDQSKLERNNRKIEEINGRMEKLNSRLEEISSDPKYLEIKIKKVINENGDMNQVKGYLTSLIQKAIEQPYMNVAADNALEEELLRATQARDTFSNEIDQKNYNIMETESPEQIRIEYLNERINFWNQDLQTYEAKIAQVDKDEQFNYHEKDERIAKLIASIKEDYEGFKKAYEEEPDVNMSVKASLKVSYEEKKEDLANAEKIAAQFKNDEAEDIKLASNLIKNECEKIKNNIANATEEIDNIKTKLMNKKTGIIDINAQNKDKDKLKELAETVMAIKHRRQFAEQPIVIAKRLEQSLNMKLITSDMLNDKTEQSIENITPDSINNDYQNEVTTEVQNEYTEQSSMETQSENVEYNQSPVEEQSIEQPVEQPIEVPVVEQPIEQPVEQPTEVPVVEQTIIQPIEEETPVEEPVVSYTQTNDIQQINNDTMQQPVDTGNINDNIVSSNIADELDKYINSLGSAQ